MSRSLVFCTLGMLAAVALAEGCTDSRGAPPAPPPRASDAGAAPTTAATTAVIHHVAAPADAGETYPLIGALFMQTPIMSEMDWPTKEEEERRRHDDRPQGPMRIGYLRQGAKVPVFPEPHVNSKCKEGWYELVQGGFVCAKYASMDLNHPRLLNAPHPPFLDRGLPYDYAYNVRNGTPLYRTVPSREQRLQYEPWLVKKPKPKIEEDNPYVDYDAGVDPTVNNQGSALGVAFGIDEDDDDAGVPWYLRDWDGGKPQVTLDDLKGEDPIIVRRMVKGFYVSLDKQMKVHHVRWWKTTYGFVAPYNRMFVAKQLTDFHGVWLNTDTPPSYPPAVAQDGGAAPPYWVDKPPTHLPLAFVSWVHAHKYTLSDDFEHAKRSDEQVSRYTPVGLTGQRKNVGGVYYQETDQGYWLREREIVVMHPGPPPSDLAPGEKWIDVNLKNQSLVAFIGDKPVYATLVSTGREDKKDKEKDHKTPAGSFRIREKHIAATMDGDVASDGPYSIEDVPWIMYFNKSYALHGAFWHNSFGHEKSHGCVNLSPDDARALFNWTEPQLPQGWHAVWATPEHPGTRVVVHDE